MVRNFLQYCRFPGTILNWLGLGRNYRGPKNFRFVWIKHSVPFKKPVEEEIKISSWKCTSKRKGQSEVWKLLPKTILISAQKRVWSESQLYPISSQGSVLCYRRALWTMAARWGKTIQDPKHGRDSAPFSDITRRAELPLYSLHDLIESKKTNYQRIQKVGPDFLFHLLCSIYIWKYIVHIWFWFIPKCGSLTACGAWVLRQPSTGE